MAMDILENSYRRLGISEAVLDFAYAVRYPLFGVCFGSVLCVIVCFLILFKGVGHQNSEEIAGGWIEKIPFDIFLPLRYN